MSTAPARMALARTVREGRIAPSQLDRAIATADSIWSKASVIDPEPAILDQTQRLLFAYPLRAADALQLAALITFANGRPREVDFISFDHRLRAAAERRGIRGSARVSSERLKC